LVQHTDKLKEINLVQSDLLAEMDNLSSKNYQTGCPKCNKPLGKLDDNVQALGKVCLLLFFQKEKKEKATFPSFTALPP